MCKVFQHEIVFNFTNEPNFAAILRAEALGSKDEVSSNVEIWKQLYQICHFACFQSGSFVAGSPSQQYIKLFRQTFQEVDSLLKVFVEETESQEKETTILNVTDCPKTL